MLFGHCCLAFSSNTHRNPNRMPSEKAAARNRRIRGTATALCSTSSIRSVYATGPGEKMRAGVDWLLVAGILTVSALSVWAQAPEPVAPAPATQAAPAPAPTPSAAPVPEPPQVTEAQKPTPPAAPTFLVPQGTKILLSLTSAVNTKSAKPGDGVYLISTFPVVVGTHVLIPAGVYVQGSVDQVVRPGHVKGRAQVGMHFTSLIFPNGSVVMIPGVVNSLPGSAGAKVKDGEGTIEQPSNKGRDLGTVLKGAAIGAEGGVIGGAATGSMGQAIGYGSLAGALAGGIYTLFQRGDDVNIPQGSIVEMVLQRPLILQEENMKKADPDQPIYTPAAQQQPMPKPHAPGMLCPVGSLGCN